VPPVPGSAAGNDAGPPSARGFQRARLEVEGGSQIQCWFNPKEYTVSKSNEWKVKPVVGAPLPNVQFGGGQARELSLDLLFDASDYNDRDVQGVCRELFRMMEVRAGGASGGGKNTKRPPTVKFTWGQTVSFSAVCKQLSVQYVLFHSDGRPIRAQAKIALVQVAPDANEGRPAQSGELEPPPQNPTTRGMAGLRTHMLRDGDSLQSISYARYGDPTLWRLLAEANGIDDPTCLPARGTVLAIPRLDQ
jgi:hypothetical protein